MTTTAQQLPQIIGIPALDDNYIWIISQGNDTFIVDPGEAEPVIRWCEQQQRIPNGILVTHTHHDHIDGIKALQQHFGVCPIYANADAQLPYSFHPLQTETTYHLGSITLTVLALPGHTPDHIGFYWAETAALFCGDSLFTGGCGRLFNGGTAEQMTATLSTIAQLPVNTAIYCAHEYTLANLRFAHLVEPNNTAITIRMAQAKEQRLHNLMTVPSRLADELATNPFLRTTVMPVQNAIEHWSGKSTHNLSERFSQLRAWKNQLDATGILEQDAC